MSEDGPPPRLEDAEDLGPGPIATAVMVSFAGAAVVMLLFRREWLWAILTSGLFVYLLRRAISAGRSPGQTGTIEASGGEIRFRFGEWVRVVSRVRGAHVFVDAEKRAIVSFDRGIWPGVSFRVANRDDAYAFVRKLGLARADSFRSEAGPRGEGGLVRAIGYGVGWYLAFVGMHLGMRDGRFYAAMLPVVLLHLVATKVEVGDDGIALRSLGRRTFIPASSIVSFRRVRKGWLGAVVRIERRDGPAISFVIGTWPLIGGTLPDWRAENVFTLEARLQDLVHLRPPAPETLRAFESASAPDVKALRLLAERLPTFRETPLTGEELLRIVASDEAPPHLRARAAVVVSAMENVAAKEALSRIAAATAHPALRVAMTAIAEDEAVEEALEQVERSSKR